MGVQQVPTKSGNPYHSTNNGQFVSSNGDGLTTQEKLNISKLFGVNHPNIFEIKNKNSKVKNLVPSDMTDYMQKHPKDNKAFVQKAYSKIKEYEALEPSVTQAITSIVDDLGGMAIGLDYRLKSLDSTMARMNKGAAGRDNPNADKALYGVKDLLRYTMCFKDNDFENKTKKAVSELTKKYDLARVLNTMRPGALYKGINCLFTDGKGHVFELQFHTPESIQAKDGFLVDIDNKKIYKDTQAKTSHSYYETIRDVKTRAKNGQATTQEIIESKKNNAKLYDLWKNVPNHSNLNLFNYVTRGV